MAEPSSADVMIAGWIRDMDASNQVFDERFSAMVQALERMRVNWRHDLDRRRREQFPDVDYGLLGPIHSEEMPP